MDPFSFLPSLLEHALLHPVVQMAWKGAVLLALLELGLRAAARRDATWTATRLHGTRLAGMAALLLLVPFSAAGPRWSVELPRPALERAEPAAPAARLVSGGPIRVVASDWVADKTSSEPRHGLRSDVEPAPRRRPLSPEVVAVMAALRAEAQSAPSGGDALAPAAAQLLASAGVAGPARPAGRDTAGWGATPDPAAGAATLRAATEATPPAGARRLPDLFTLLFVGWLAGVVAVGARLCVGLWRVRGFVRRSRPIVDGRWLGQAARLARRLGMERPVELRVSRDLAVPVAFGWARPVVLLPEGARGWTPERRRLVLLHELAHIRRRDWPAHLLARLATALYWYLPAAWRAERRLHLERERACDALVLAAGPRPSDYAAHLVALARDAWTRRQGVPALAMIERSELEERIMTLLHPTPSGRGRRVPAWLALAATATLSLPLLLVQPTVAAEGNGPRLSARLRQVAGELDAEARALKERAAVAEADWTMERWAEAHDGFTRLAADQPDEGRWPFMAGYCEIRLGRHDDAVRNFERAIELGHRPDLALYNIACAHAQAGRAAEALDALEGAVARHKIGVEMILTDADFAPLHDEPRFVEVVRAAALKNGTYGELGELLDRIEAGDVVPTGERGPDEWFAAGLTMLSADRPDDALACFMRTYEADHDRMRSAYNIACAHAMKNDADAAIEWLGRAVELGYDDARHMKSDDDLAGIHEDPRFAEIAAKAAAAARKRPRALTFAPMAPVPPVPPVPGRAVAPMAPDAVDPEAAAAFDRGYDLIVSGKARESIAEFERAIEAGYLEHLAEYNIACAHALLAELDAAFEHLDAAIENGFFDAAMAKADKDLKALREDPRFAEALARMKAAQKEAAAAAYGVRGSVGAEVAAAMAEAKAGLAEARAGLAEAAKAFSSGGWSRRSAEEIAAQEAFELGFELIVAGKPDEALEQFEKSRAGGYAPATSTYNIACCHALAGRTEAALDALEEAVEMGFDDPEQIRGDGDLASLRSEPRFKALLKKVEQMSDEE